jgi:hypothetical protein
MSKENVWTELRAFESCEPSVIAFRAMVALLDTWPNDDQEEAIALADKILSNWPDAVRIAPWSLCKAASAGSVQPTWSLVRSLQLTSGHLTKADVDLARLAAHAPLGHVSELELPSFSEFKELSLLYHCPELFPKLRRLRAYDKYDDGEVRAIAGSSIWRTLEVFETEPLSESFAHSEPSRIVPHLHGDSPIRHVSLRACDLIEMWDANAFVMIRTACVFIRSVDEAIALAQREELARLHSLSIAFRCGFSGSSAFDPCVGTVIEADEAASEAFFGNAKLDQLKRLVIAGYSMGYWGREGLGKLGLVALIDSGLLQRLKSFRLERLPLGDEGIAAIAPALGTQLESLELVDVYCKGAGAGALIESPCMASLRTLDLSANRIDADHVSRMASVHMPNLESLDLSGPAINPYYWNIGVQPILDDGAAAWANSDNAKRLKRLRFSNCHLTDAALTSVFHTSNLHILTDLDLSHSWFTAAGFSQIANSPLWNTLKRLTLNDCRLDNDSIEALARVPEAPALRAVELAYNAISTRGAVALADWSVLSSVWQLNLHDNLIGDEGLVALSQSSNLCRLLDLDLEQDCWNSRKFTFNDVAANAFANSTSFPRLECLWSGCVDEYHGAAYSPGFTKEAIGILRKSKWMRPAMRIAISDFSGIHEYCENEGFDEDRELSDHDFRSHTFTLNEKEGTQSPHRMRQLSTARSPDRRIDEMGPAKISPLSEIVVNETADDEHFIEGLECCDPIPATDHFVMLDLSLEDDQRPLPNQVGKFVSDTLRPIFQACSIGNFEVGGGGSRKCEDGSYIATDVTFYVSYKGDPTPAIQLIREVMWWVGAPHETQNTDLPLALSVPPANGETHFVQLAIPTVFRWSSGHRIDRSAFSLEQRKTARKIIRELGEEDADGWVRALTSDGGKVSVFTKHLDKSAEFDSLDMLVDSLTPQVSQFIYRVMRDCGLMMFPMAIAVDEAIAKLIDCEWPTVTLVSSEQSLNDLLIRGAYDWWRN